MGLRFTNRLVRLSPQVILIVWSPLAPAIQCPPGEFTYLLTGQTFSKSSRTGQAAPSAAVVGVNISSPTISQPWLTVYEHSML